MGLFGKSNAFESGDMVTVVGPEAYFHGTMTVRGSIRVEGKVEGDILEAQIAIVGPGGQVRGNVCAESVVVAGLVSGDIVASAALEIKSTGKVAGNIRCAKLFVEEGAVFDGACAMSEKTKPSHAHKTAESAA